MDFLHPSDIISATQLGFRENESRFLFSVRKSLASYTQYQVQKGVIKSEDSAVFYVTQLNTVIDTMSLDWDLIYSQPGMYEVTPEINPAARYKLGSCLLLREFPLFCEYLPTYWHIIFFQTDEMEQAIARVFIAMMVWVMIVDGVSP